MGSFTLQLTLLGTASCICISKLDQTGISCLTPICLLQFENSKPRLCVSDNSWLDIRWYANHTQPYPGALLSHSHPPQDGRDYPALSPEMFTCLDGPYSSSCRPGPKNDVTLVLCCSWVAWTSRLRPIWRCTKKLWGRSAFTRRWTMEFCCQCPWTRQWSWPASSPTQLCKRNASWSSPPSCLCALM